MKPKAIVNQKRRYWLVLFAFMLSLTGLAQNARITGTVIDSNNEPIIGASIFEVGTSNGAVTDLDGRFTLNVPNGAKLKITYVGYKTQEVKAQDGMKIVLEDSAPD